MAYCPHSDGVEPHPLDSSASAKIGASKRLTTHPPSELYLWGFNEESRTNWSFSGGFYREIWFESLIPSKASSVIEPRVRKPSYSVPVPEDVHPPIKKGRLPSAAIHSPLYLRAR